MQVTCKNIELPSFLFFFLFLWTFKVEMRKLNDEIKVKNEQISLLEKQIADSIVASHNKMNKMELSQVCLSHME